MRGLLDTHSFLWAAEDDPKLSASARTFLADSANTIVLSVVGVWEIVIKSKLGKLPLSMPIGAILSRLPRAGIKLLPVQVDHALAAENLPDVHRDPFDRLLAAQAVVEGAVLVTTDPVFAQYPVTVVW